MLLSKSNVKNKKLNNLTKNETKKNDNHYHYVNSLKIINKNNNKFIGKNKKKIKKQLEKIKYINNNNSKHNIINDYNFNNNDSYLRKYINNTIHTFMHDDSSENSKSENKCKKIIKNQFIDSSKKKNHENKNKRINNDKIMANKNEINKLGRIILNNSVSNKICYNENFLNNNININNLININNFKKNNNCNFYCNTNNHFIKNSRLKKNNFANILKKNLTKNEINKNFSNELKNYYLNTEIIKNNNNNLSYSNFIKNNISLNNYDFSIDYKFINDFLIYFF